MRLTVRYEFAFAGLIQLELGRLRFPSVAEIPGAYRLELPGRVYIGETERLNRRFRQYRAPGCSQATNLRLNRLIVETLNSGVSPSVWIVTEAEVEVDEQAWPLDLRDKSARLLIESAALTAEHLAGRPVENL